ncbi:MAG: glycosyltransferase family 87 protein [Phycisphaerae bacterium]
MRTSGNLKPIAGSSARLRRPWRWCALGLLLAAIVAGDAWRFVGAMHHGKPTLKRWLPYAAELGRDDQLYERHPDYLYPPFFLVLLRPLTLLSPNTAAVIWQIAKWVALIGTFVLAWSVLARDGPLPVWVRVGSVLMSLRFIASDLGHGNVNLFIAFLVMAALWLLMRGRAMASGGLIAMAACIKVTPALWVLYLLYKRQWRALLGAGFGALLALELVPLAVLTPSTNHALLQRWYRHVVHGYATTGHVFSTRMNQSMTAVTNRLLGRGDFAPGEPPVAVVSLSPRTVVGIQRALAAAVLLGLLWSCRGRFPRGDATAVCAEWSIVGACTLLLSGYTWTGHFCALILAHATVLAYLSRTWSAHRDAPVAILVLLSFALLSLTGDLLTPDGRRWASAVGLPMIGVMVLMAGLWLIRSRRRCVAR